MKASKYRVTTLPLRTKRLTESVAADLERSRKRGIT